VLQRIHRLEAEVQRLSDLLALHFDAHGDRLRATEASESPRDVYLQRDARGT
jgi:hypothetical protein